MEADKGCSNEGGDYAKKVTRKNNQIPLWDIDYTKGQRDKRENYDEKCCKSYQSKKYC